MSKKFRITVDGKAYEVEVEEITTDGETTPPPRQAAKPAATKAVPQPKPAASKPAETAGGEDVTAPMPGTILQLLVGQGDKVEEGQPLLVLEAMKMENNITAPKAGTVVAIAVSQGQSVESGQRLLTIG